MYNCGKASLSPLVLPYSVLNCSRRARFSIANPSIWTYLLLNIAILKIQRVDLKKYILPALGLSLQSQLTFPPGNCASSDCGTFNLLFQREEPAGTLSGLSALPCHHHRLLILLTPLFSTPRTLELC